jgi:hypothetical protein
MHYPVHFEERPGFVSVVLKLDIRQDFVRQAPHTPGNAALAEDALFGGHGQQGLCVTDIAQNSDVCDGLKKMLMQPD